MTPLLVVIIALVASACFVDAQPYQTVTTITGTGDLTTDYFNIPTDEWRITWSYTPNPTYPEYAGFLATIYPKGESAMYTEMITQYGDNQTSGVTYIHEGQKDYYIVIGAANVESYTLKIEAVEAGPTPSIPEFPLGGFSLIILLFVATGTVVIINRKHHNHH